MELDSVRSFFDLLGCESCCRRQALVGNSRYIDYAFFAVCIDRPLLENTFLNRLQRVFIWVGILLIYMALFYSPKLWHALTIVLSSEVLFIDVLLLIFAPWRTKNTLRLSFILFTVLVESAALAVNIVQADWVGFLLFGLAMSFSFAVVLVYFRELKSEIRWRIFGG